MAEKFKRWGTIQSTFGGVIVRFYYFQVTIRREPAMSSERMGMVTTTRAFGRYFFWRRLKVEAAS